MAAGGSGERSGTPALGYRGATMIVRVEAPVAVVVTQADHARLAADLLALLRLPGLADHPRRAELLRAVADHDNGWWEVDAAPRIDPASGRPLGFLAVPAALRREVWRRGVERFAAEFPWGAALTATHLLRLSARWAPDPEWAAERAELVRRRDELVAASGRDLAGLAADDRWLELADELSLAATTGDGAFVEAAGWRAAVACARDGIELALDPFPLAGASRVSLRARRIPDRSWADDGELARALAAARWESLAVLVAPRAG